MIVNKSAKFKSVLLIGDTHLPYEHCDYLAFLKHIEKKHNCELIIHMGDYEDQHAISFHSSDCELLSAGDELELVIEKTQTWKEEFPVMHIIDSNHGSLVFRRLKVEGIPIKHIKHIKEIYETPTWQWHDDIMLKTKLGNVYLTHGKTSAYNKLAREVGCSSVQAHFHGKFEITYANSVFRERFNMFVGCGISRESLAFAYGKNNIPQPILGCGVIDSDGIPHLEKMILDKNNRWIGAK